MSSRSAIHHSIRPPRRIRSMHGEPWHLRKTVGANISSDQYQQFKSIADSHGVSVSMFLRAMIVDVLAEEGGFVPQNASAKCSLLKSA